MDESLFTHINNTQQWVVGMINITAKNIRIEIVNDRITETLKMIIAKHLGKGNIIHTDLWPGYNYLTNSNSGHQHITSNHSIMQFGLTAQIESIWDNLKDIIKKLYTTIPARNFVYFLREAEYRHMIYNLSISDKIINFADLLITLNGNEELFTLSEDELK